MYETNPLKYGDFLYIIYKPLGIELYPKFSRTHVQNFYSRYRIKGSVSV